MRSPDIIPAVSAQLWQSLSDSVILQHPRLAPRHPLSLSLLISWDVSLLIFLPEDTETPVTEGWDEHTPVR